jgi:uncharacterized protein YjbI with pentapeptide repeats
MRSLKANLRPWHVCALAGSAVLTLLLVEAELLAVRMRPYWTARYHGENAILRTAPLAGFNLREVNLRWADLSTADLRGTVLAGANLWAAKLVGAHLTGTDLTGADLERADLTDTNLARAKLAQANLEGATYNFGTVWPAGFQPRKRGAVLDLSDGNFRGASLRGADLRGAEPFRADFTDADLTGAKLGGAHYSENTRWPRGFDPWDHGASLQMDGGEYRGVRWRGVNLRGADLEDAEFSGADLRQANLSYTYLAHTWFDNARLDGVNLTGAVYDEQTAWPDGFNPEAHGARYCQEESYRPEERERLRSRHKMEKPDGTRDNWSAVSLPPPPPLARQ